MKSLNQKAIRYYPSVHSIKSAQKVIGRHADAIPAKKRRAFIINMWVNWVRKEFLS